MYLQHGISPFLVHKIMYCKICGNITEYFGKTTVLRKYTAVYQKCPKCGFVYTQNPYWLSESYENAIASTDIGTVSRAGTNSIQAKSIIELLFTPSAKFLDYGSGYGIFVRRMRDIGYDYLAYDRHCANLFLEQFTVSSIVNDSFELVTAYEVVEHLEEPLVFF